MRSIAVCLRACFTVLLTGSLASCDSSDTDPGGTGTGTTPVHAFECVADTPVAAAGLDDTGYATCQNGVLHRPASVTCASLLPRAQQCTPTGQLGVEAPCATDEDCGDAPYGYCDLRIFDSGGVHLQECGCTYGCVTDADCDAGSICYCAEPVGRCMAASCAVDADCGEAFCRSYPLLEASWGCFLRVGFACEGRPSACVTDEECGTALRCATDGTAALCAGQCLD